jgi:hypothetical protein
MSNVKEVKSKIIKITLNDGVERSLSYTLNALAELEEVYGSVQNAFDKLEKENSMRALRTILWAGFIHESPDLTEQEVGNLIDMAYMQTLVETLNQAFEEDMPAEEETTGPNA